MNIEYNLGLVAGSIACLRPFFAKIGLTKSGDPDSGDQNRAGVLIPSFKLRTIGGGPKWHKCGQPAHRGAASRVQGESILNTVVTLGVGFEDEGQLAMDDISRHGSTEKIVRANAEERCR